MTSAIQVGGSVAAASSSSYSITVANNGGTPGRFGFAPQEATNPGACSPITTFRGVDIRQIRSSTGENFLVVLAGTRAQTFWRRIVVQSTAGTWRTFLSADATFSAGIDTSWSFGNGSDPIWTSTTSPRGVLIFI